MSSKEPTIAISAHQNDIHEADLAEASQLIASLQLEDADEMNEVFVQAAEASDEAAQTKILKPKTAKSQKARLCACTLAGRSGGMTSQLSAM